MRAVMLLVACAGCDNLFHASPIRVVDAPPIDVLAEPMPDATLPPCTPTQFTGTAILLQSTMIEVAIAEAANAAIGTVQAAPDLEFLTALDGSSGLGDTTIANPVYLSPALSTNGTSLYVSDGAKTYVFFAIIAGLSTWTPRMQVTDLAGYRPGAVVMVGTSRHMVAATGTPATFRELASDNGTTWTTVFGVLDAATIAGNGAVVMSAPNLTADARVLVYVADATDVRYILRPDITKGFDQPGTQRGLLVHTSDALASPYLSADCGHLFVVDGGTGIPALVRY